jgi:Ca-activated chloride channel family protein
MTVQDIGRNRVVQIALVVGLVALVLLARGAGDSAAVAADPPGTIKLLFLYGSEKQDWIDWATEGTLKKDGKKVVVNQAAFNLTDQRLNGKRILVEAIPIGSGESVDEVREARRKAHLLSPASGAFIKLGNAAWRAQLQKEGKPAQDLVGATKSLVRSPVVIAMWEPMAKALGWPDKAIGWAEILALAKNDNAWKDHGYPEWDPFKFGHTHPELSNSGLISIFAEVYAAPSVHKDQGLTLDDVNNPDTGKFVESIEQSVVFYGSSTGFFGKKMFANGPGYLSAAVMYENMVIESYDPRKYEKQFNVVAIYPKEGTFMSDHPVAIVQREWVDDEHRQAAAKYIEFLLGEVQQKEAMVFGFRPGLDTIPLAAPLDAKHGVDPQQPQKQLEVPSAEVMKAILDLWKKSRKQTSIILVMDTSGSMRNNNRLTNAKSGAKLFLAKLGSRDLFTLISFSEKVAAPVGPIPLATERDRANKAVDQLAASGETALYDAIGKAYDIAQGDDHKKLIPAVLVLTDGMNNWVKGKKVTYDENRQGLKDLLNKIKPDPEKRLTPIFTIGYSLDPKKPEEKEALDALKQIAETTDGDFFIDKPETIEDLFRLLPKKGF